jgi:stage II sporulation protein P
MTNHEPPKLATSYDRSLVTMQKYHEMYPSIRLFIDLHRDAYQDPTAPADYVEINGTQTARLMFVVGKGEKYSDKPYLSSNTELTEFMTSYLQSIDPKLARPIRVKPGRYNQHVAPNCILVEVGHNANTLEQAIAAAPYLAESIVYAFASCSVVETWAPN